MSVRLVEVIEVAREVDQALSRRGHDGSEYSCIGCGAETGFQEAHDETCPVRRFRDLIGRMPEPK